MQPTFKCTLRAPAVLTGCACLMLASLSGQSTSNTQMDAGSNKMLKSLDVAFATKAAQDGMAEIRFGQLAVEKASNPDVKAFGQSMIDDHSKANNELKAIVGKQGMTLPDAVAARDQALRTKLLALSGVQFDQAYMKAMVKDHGDDVKEFQKEVKAGKDGAIKDFASRTLPFLQSHLEKAKSLAASVSGKKGK